MCLFLGTVSHDDNLNMTFIISFMDVYYAWQCVLKGVKQGVGICCSCCNQEVSFSFFNSICQRGEDICLFC